MLTIARYSLPSPVLLAPMAGVTDSPWRQVCQEYGAGLTTCEMLTAQSALWHSDKSRLRLQASDQSRLPHSVQIVGSEPAMLADAARQAEKAGARLIDINMGCPAKKVCKKAAGSALLRDEKLVAAILQAVVQASNVPVTLKIRTGWDCDNRNAVSVAAIAEQAGIQALAVHGRTRACRFNGEAEYDTIAQVKQSVNIPVIANGDIDSVEKALFVKDYTGADGLMLGRAVQGRPWLIRQINAALAGGAAEEPHWRQKLDCMRLHCRAIHDFYGEQKGLGFVRKHMAFYLEHLQLSHCRQTFNRIDNADAQMAFIDCLRDHFTEGKAA